MSNQQSGKRVFWRSWLFWFGVIAAIYLLTVRIEETAYEKFKGQWTTYTGDNSPLLYDPIRILVTDDKGCVWIGTEWGLYAIESNGTWKTFTTENSGLSNDNIRALAVDESGKIWVAGGGLHVLDSNGQWTTVQPGRDWESIHALAFDSQDRIWVGTFGGLVVLDENSIEKIYTKENSGLIDNSVTALAIDRFDRIWVGTFGYGVSVLNPEGHWITYQEDTQRPRSEDNDILTFLIDPQERVWIGTYHGIKVISPDGTRTSNTGFQWGIAPSSLISVESFALDQQNRMWIAIAGRLVVVDSKKNSFTTYTWDNSGLPGVVNALVIDENEKLWVGTVKGLSVIDLRKELPKTVPDRWLSLRAKLLVPIDVVSTIGELLFLPAKTIFGICYIPLLITVIVAFIGMKLGSRENNPKLYSRSLSVFIFSIVGVSLLWVLSLYLLIMFRD